MPAHAMDASCPCLDSQSRKRGFSSTSPASDLNQATFYQQSVGAATVSRAPTTIAARHLCRNDPEAQMCYATASTRLNSGVLPAGCGRSPIPNLKVRSGAISLRMIMQSSPTAPRAAIAHNPCSERDRANCTAISPPGSPSFLPQGQRGFSSAFSGHSHFGPHGLATTDGRARHICASSS